MSSPTRNTSEYTRNLHKIQQSTRNIKDKVEDQYENQIKPEIIKTYENFKKPIRNMKENIKETYDDVQSDFENIDNETTSFTENINRKGKVFVQKIKDNVENFEMPDMHMRDSKVYRKGSEIIDNLKHRVLPEELDKAWNENKEFCPYYVKQDVNETNALLITYARGFLAVGVSMFFFPSFWKSAMLSTHSVFSYDSNLTNDLTGLRCLILLNIFSYI